MGEMALPYISFPRYRFLFFFMCEPKSENICQHLSTSVNISLSTAVTAATNPAFSIFAAWGWSYLLSPERHPPYRNSLSCTRTRPFRAAPTLPYIADTLKQQPAPTSEDTTVAVIVGYYVPPLNFHPKAVSNLYGSTYGTII